MSNGYMSIMDRYEIKKLRAEGWKRQDIADHTGYSLRSIDNVLTNSTGYRKQQIADRLEAILGGCEPDNGTYHTVTPYTEENPVRSEYRALQEYSELVFLAVALFEEREEDIRTELERLGIDEDDLE